MEIINKAKQEIQETKQEFVNQMLALINGAFALVAALAWNEAVKALIDQYLPTASAVYSRFAYAVLITFLVVVISMRLAKISKRLKSNS